MKNHKMLLGVTFALSILIGCQKKNDLLGYPSSDSSPVDSSLTGISDSSQIPPTAGAAPALSHILIDAGATPTSKDQWGKYWNTMADARKGVRVLNAVNTLNVPTTIKLEVISPTGTTSTTDNGLRKSEGDVGNINNYYPATATGDNAFAHINTANGKWKIGGLTVSSTYTIKFWGTYKGPGNRFVQIKRADQTAWQEFNSSLNTDTSKSAKFTFTGKTNLEFDIRVKSGSNYGYISVIDITELPTSAPDGKPTNIPPTANAGTDATITLPTNSYALKGSGTDTDGTIVSYAWTRTAGPSQFTLSNATAANPTLSNLVAGTYTFRLTVKDNIGATATDDVNILVNPVASGGKSYTLKFASNGDAYYPNGTGLGWGPGDTVYIPAGSYHLIDLGNVRGSASKPIIITNKGGLVNVGQIRLGNKMENFKILGNGVSGITYGIKITNLDANIAFAAGLVSNMEVAYIEVAKAATGIMVKKNPVAGDPTTQYGYYRISNIKIHNNYLHDITNEGMYIGNTSPSGSAAGIPIRLENVEIYSNKLERIGWDGIQMSCTIGTNSIHDNNVNNFGTSNFEAQRTGIAIGSAATGDIYNNSITNGTGWGVNAMGYGLMKIYNNTISNVGATGIGTGSESIYADDRIAGPETFAKQQIQVTNNTIRNPQKRGAVRIGAYNNNSLPSTITGNKLYIPQAPTNWITTNLISNVAGSNISGNTLLLQ
ncbi:MAG: right-handed parallel beta-helix repeat-containing protein [Chitinophagaceae bacterium]